MRRRGKPNTSIIFVFFASLFAAQQLSGWPVVRLWGASLWESAVNLDAVSVLNSAECLKLLSWTDQLSTGFGKCGYIYGNTLVYVLNFLQFTPESAWIIAWLGGLGLSFVFAVLVQKLIKNQSLHWGVPVIAALSLASPPIALLLERANFDSIIFLVVSLGCLLAARNRVAAAAVTLAFGALLKFYAVIPLWAAVMLRHKAARPQRWIFVGVTALVTASIVVEIFLRRPTIPDDVGAAFGLKSFGLWFNLLAEYFSIPVTLNTPLQLLLGGAALGVSALVLKLFSQRALFETTAFEHKGTARDFFDYLAFASASTFLGCYMLGMNFDYRLVFLLPFAFHQLNAARTARARRTLAIALLGAFWLSYEAGVPGQILGELFIGFWAITAFLALWPAIFDFAKTFKFKNKSKPTRSNSESERA